MVLIGVGTLVFTGVFVVHRLLPYVDNPPKVAAYGLTQLPLERGTYVLFARPTADRSQYDLCYRGFECATFGPRDVIVTSLSGRRLTVLADTTSDRISQNERTYPGIVEFYVPSPGLYRIMTDQAVGRSIVVVDPSPGQEFHAFAGWTALGVGGLLVVLLGIASIIGAVVHRQRLRQLRLPESPLAYPYSPPVTLP